MSAPSLLAPSLFLLLAIRALPGPASEGGRCTVDVIAAGNLTPAAFRAGYYLQRPVIVRNVSVDLWNLDALAAEYGSVRIAVGTSSDLIRDRGSGKGSVRLDELALRVMAAGGGGSSEEQFAFERNPKLFRVAPHLIRNVMPMEIMKGLNRTLSTGIDWYFSLGGRGAGVHLHHHTDGFAFIHAGVKRFFFYEPWSSLPPIAYRIRFPISQWREKLRLPKVITVRAPVGVWGEDRRFGIRTRGMVACDYCRKRLCSCRFISAS